MFLHSTREGDYPNQIQHPENIPHPLQTAGPGVISLQKLEEIDWKYTNLMLSFRDWKYTQLEQFPKDQVEAVTLFKLDKLLDIAIAGLYAEQNILIFKVLASFLAGILKLMHHMVNLSNESGQA